MPSWSTRGSSLIVPRRAMILLQRIITRRGTRTQLSNPGAPAGPNTRGPPGTTNAAPPRLLFREVRAFSSLNNAGNKPMLALKIDGDQFPDSKIPALLRMLERKNLSVVRGTVYRQSSSKNSPCDKIEKNSSSSKNSSCDKNHLVVQELVVRKFKGGSSDPGDLALAMDVVEESLLAAQRLLEPRAMTSPDSSVSVAPTGAGEGGHGGITGARDAGDGADSRISGFAIVSADLDFCPLYKRVLQKNLSCYCILPHGALTPESVAFLKSCCTEVLFFDGGGKDHNIAECDKSFGARAGSSVSKKRVRVFALLLEHGYVSATETKLLPPLLSFVYRNGLVAEVLEKSDGSLDGIINLLLAVVDERVGIVELLAVVVDKRVRRRFGQIRSRIRGQTNRNRFVPRTP